MDTVTVKPNGTRKLRPPVVEALLAEVAALDVAVATSR